MNKFNNKQLTGNSQKLRSNMTKEERHLWYDFLKGLSLTIHRQKVIDKYIVDFYCAKKKLVIEIDGSQHYETKGKENDEKRDENLNSMGITVLRFSNYDINNHFNAVCEEILKHLNT